MSLPFRTLRTGTSKTGKVHRYYARSSRNRHGKTDCKRRSIKMDKLDSLVTDTVSATVLNAERLTRVLASLADRRTVANQALDQRLSRLEHDAEAAGEKLTRLYRLVEDA